MTMPGAPPVNALTIDLEEWFHGLTSANAQVARWPTWPRRAALLTDRLLALLAAHDVCATFFVVGELAAAEPALLRRLADAGHEIGVHGFLHRFVHRLTPAQFRDELRRTTDAIRRAVGDVPLWGHRAPYFSINASCLWALDVLAEEGFAYDASLLRTRNPLYGFAAAPLQPVRLANGLCEFPTTTIGLGQWRLPYGGFGWRLLPGALVRTLVQRAQAQGPVVAYLHPWEFDLAQPSPTRLTPRERITHRLGRRRLWGTWSLLLRQFAWQPLCAWLSHADRLPPWSLA